MTKNYLAIIPARGGSQRIPRKNLVSLGGKPLIAYTIEAAQISQKLTGVIVSTEDREIATTALKYGAEIPFLRPGELAMAQSTMFSVIQNVLDNIGKRVELIDAIVLLQPTSPFRSGKHIDEAIALFEESPADTVVAGCLAQQHPFYAWALADGEARPFFSLRHLTMDRHELPPAFYENGAIYVIAKAVLDSGSIYGKRVIPYLMDHMDSVDIDTPLDLLWAEFILGNARK